MYSAKKVECILDYGIIVKNQIEIIILKRNHKMEDFFEFLKKCGTFYIETEDGDKSRLVKFKKNISDWEIYE